MAVVLKYLTALLGYLKLLTQLSWLPPGLLLATTAACLSYCATKTTMQEASDRS